MNTSVISRPVPAAGLPPLRELMPIEVPTLPPALRNFMSGAARASLETWKLDNFDKAAILRLADSLLSLMSYVSLSDSIDRRDSSIPPAVLEEIWENQMACRTLLIFAWLIQDQFHLSIAFLVSVLSRLEDGAKVKEIPWLDQFLQDCTGYLISSVDPEIIPGPYRILTGVVEENLWHRDLLTLAQARSQHRNDEIETVIGSLKACTESKVPPISAAAHYLLATLYGRLSFPSEELTEYCSWYEKAAIAYDCPSVIEALQHIQQPELKRGTLTGVSNYAKLLSRASRLEELSVMEKLLREWGQTELLTNWPSPETQAEGTQVYVIDRDQAQDDLYIGQVIYDILLNSNCALACCAVRNHPSPATFPKDAAESAADYLQSRFKTTVMGWSLVGPGIDSLPRTWFVLSHPGLHGAITYVAVAVDERVDSFVVEVLPAHAFAATLVDSDEILRLRESIASCPADVDIESARNAVATLAKAMRPATSRRIELPPG